MVESGLRKLQKEKQLVHSGDLDFLKKDHSPVVPSTLLKLF